MLTFSLLPASLGLFPWWLSPQGTLKKFALPSFSRTHKYKECFNLTFLCNSPSIFRMLLKDSTWRTHFPFSVFQWVCLIALAKKEGQRGRGGGWARGGGGDSYIFSNYRIYGKGNSYILNIYHLCPHPVPTTHTFISHGTSLLVSKENNEL